MAKKTPSYETAIAELENIVAQIEMGNLPISQLSTQLQRAQELLNLCQNQLKKVEDEVNKILDADAE